MEREGRACNLGRLGNVTGVPPKIGLPGVRDCIDVGDWSSPATDPSRSCMTGTLEPALTQFRDNEEKKLVPLSSGSNNAVEGWPIGFPPDRVTLLSVISGDTTAR